VHADQGRPYQSSHYPPPLNNHGTIGLLSRLTEWLGKLVEEAGFTCFRDLPGTEVLYENERVIGIRTGDKNRCGRKQEIQFPSLGIDLTQGRGFLAKDPEELPRT